MHGGSRRVAVIGILALVVAVLPSSVADATGSTGSTEGTADWRRVSAGGRHSCGIRITGRLYCWGDDSDGELGDDAALANMPTPTEVAGNHTDWITVAVGANHTCARRATGRLYCWGRDSAGQLGDGPVLADQPTPVEVVGNHTNWTTVALGVGHTCARRATGRLYCWGSDNDGELGDNAAHADQPTPVQVAGNHTNWGRIFAGGDGHTCATRLTGRLYCWGNDSAGQLGDNAALANQPTPVQVAGNHTNWTSVTGGANHTCAGRATGRLYCWGNDSPGGSLGDNTALADQPTPVQVAGSHTDWTSVTGGAGHSCGRRNSARIYCWGNDNSGQVGDDPILASQPTPIQVAP